MLATIVCADWSQEPRHRDAYVADVDRRTVSRLGVEPLTLPSLLRGARERHAAPTIVGIDAPLGAPRSLLDATRAALDVPPTATFPQWLARLSRLPQFFDPVNEPAAWSPLRPFFRVSKGPDGLGQWFRAMRSHGVEPYRLVDKATSAKSAFILSGIPGSVGSSVRDVWRSLAEILGGGDGGPRVWPFDPREPEDATAGVVLAEIYPRALYAPALLSEAPGARSRLSVAKTDPGCRRAAIECLLDHDWVRRHGVTFADADPDSLTEDACDALLSAAGALRCVLEGTPLGGKGADPFEGGILGLESVDLSRPERTFRWKDYDEPEAP